MSDWNSFKGAAKRLDDIDLPKIGDKIKVGEDELHAFIETETTGSGFDKSGRPAMLFEPHVFYRNLKGPARDKAVKAGLAYAKWGEKPYPRDSYSRLQKAMAIDETAALKAASWGLGQVLGENFKMAGYSSVQDMVRDFMEDEEAHLTAMVNYIVAAKLDDDLRKLAALKRPTTPDDCRAIVSVYNGPKYEKNKYHIKFANNHNKWRKISDTPWSATPSVAPSVGTSVPTPITQPIKEQSEQAFITQLQTILRDKGYPEVGDPDGRYGNRTRNAILAFQADNSLPLTGLATDDVLAALVKAPARQQSASRSTATAEDLKDKGVPTVTLADRLKKIGQAVLGAMGVGAIGQGATDFDQIKSKLDSAKGLSDTLLSFSPWIIGGLVAGGLIYGGVLIIQAQVTAYRKGHSV